MTKVISNFWSKKKPRKNLLYLEDRSDFAKFEIWEVLTFLTLVFTLASIMFWFSSFYPQHSQTEFLFIDQQKSKIYNSFLETKSKTQGLPILLKAEKEVDLAKQNLPDYLFMKQNLASWQINLSYLEKEKQELEKLSSEIQTQTGFLRGSENLINFLQEYQAYLDQKQAQKNGLKTSVDYILEIRTGILALHSQERLEFQDGVSRLQKIYQEESFKSYFNNTQSQELLSQKLGFLNSLENDMETFQANHSQELSQSLKYFLAINQSDLLDIENLSEKPSENKIFISIQKLETWQKEFLESRGHLKDRVVWINY